MGGGDLNLKKSWHPGLMRNQAAVWQREQDALDERKKIAERQREIQEERERNELLALQDPSAVSHPSRQHERVEWMYAAPQGGTLGLSEEVSSFLMGRNVVDELLNQSESMGSVVKNDPGAADSFVTNGSTTAVSHSSSSAASRDISTKVREDPMLLIRKEQQAVVNAIRNNPKRLAELRASRNLSPPSSSRFSSSRTSSHRSSTSHHSSHRSSTPHHSSSHRPRSPARHSQYSHSSSGHSSGVHKSSSSRHSSSHSSSHSKSSSRHYDSRSNEDRRRSSDSRRHDRSPPREHHRERLTDESDSY
ncbi:N-terminal domain of CBF1 interacting co-repressor CIR-domain-containing protein [Lipomyces oligophaga]|uniref:N-terminal domain of CBF1 interacting co-repressor CIR-domain-containing protein n=1 Tax=Lipomyces oligophaga TaxID=45792 RepID=UPI0034CEB842